VKLFYLKINDLERVEIELDRMGFPRGAKRDSS